MPTVEDLSHSLSTVASGTGTGSVTFQNTAAGHRWTVKLITATSGLASATVTVARNGVQTIDTSDGDTRPDVTSDSTYSLQQFESVKVSWAGMTAAQNLVATLTYDDSWT